MDLMDLIQSQLFSKNTITDLANETDAQPEKVEALTKLAIPTMLEALKKNASNEEGKKSLEKALDDHQEDPSNLSAFFKKADQEDGAKILNHMFGSQTETVTNNLASTSGLDLGTVMNLLTKYAPRILSALALSKVTAQKKSSQTKEASGFDLGDLLGGLVSSTSKKSEEGGLLDGIKDVLGGFLK